MGNVSTFRTRALAIAQPDGDDILGLLDRALDSMDQALKFQQATIISQQKTIDDLINKLPGGHIPHRPNTASTP